MIILKGAKIYTRPVGGEPGAWQPLGAVTDGYVSVSGEDDELVETMRKPIKPITMTFKLSKNRLERRALLRMLFGIESGSLIHHGKKRRRK